MIKNLVAFGCGWTFGVELENTLDSYPGQIASHNGWTLENLSKPKTSLKEMLADFTEWLNTSSPEHIAESVVLVGLTNEDLDNGPELGEQTYVDTVTAFDELAEKHHVKLLQFNVLTKQYKVKMPTLIKSSSALEMLVIRDKLRKDHLFTEHMYPNKKGHQILADFLIDKVNSVIITE